ncbi:F-box/LRR-repeat protein 18 [Bagarius yarrelli]|uniref:F-box/LRR-repeat protein 18 n=1 Tax=Bagarius yarrelli TaxID=175774 RepID=A0A556VAS3_BAGYA|nr:F-box/LRR-repeat protein 18 [Bagarius yarrelli]
MFVCVCVCVCVCALFPTQARCSPEIASQSFVSIFDFSDEILLHILSYVPVYDLVLSVSRVCRKLQTLCQDKCLISHVRLHLDYRASDEAVKRLLKELCGSVQTLDASGCYWLSGSTLDVVTRCVGLVRLDVSGWRVTSTRLSRLLGSLQRLRSLALDIGAGFDLHQLSTHGKAALARITELKQTLRTHSYGVVPCCSALQSLSLYLEVADGWCHLELTVEQSSVPRYHNLRWFSAHLAPGEVNRRLLSLYLAAFSMRVPEGLTGCVIAMPSPAPPIPASAALLTQGILSAGSAVSAFQLPPTWLDGAMLRRLLGYGCPAYLNVSRCATSGFEPLCVLLGAACELSPLHSLNLRGKTEEEVDAEGIRTLSESCPHLAHFNLSSTHYHYTASEITPHLCAALGRLRALRSLALPACALSRGPPATANKPDLARKLGSDSLLLGLKKIQRVGVQAYQPALDSTGGLREEQEAEAESFLHPLINGCPYLVELELIGTGFLSAMPRYEPAMRKDPPACPWSFQVGDAQLAALGQLRFLRRLTLAHLPGVLKGTGLVQLALGCKDLQVLSLANLGSLKNVNYTVALQEALKHCTQLRELRLTHTHTQSKKVIAISLFNNEIDCTCVCVCVCVCVCPCVCDDRLEQPHFSANTFFFEALAHCRLLCRFCLISRHGTFQHAAAVRFMQHCEDVVVFHMFTGGTQVACKTLQKTLQDE